MDAADLNEPEASEQIDDEGSKHNEVTDNGDNVSEHYERESSEHNEKEEFAHQIPDTSVLSPVGSITSDELLPQPLNQDVPEVQSSEAETDTENEAPQLDLSRNLLRKRGNDPDRRRIKRQLLSTSDAETNDETTANFDYNSDFSAKPHTTSDEPQHSPPRAEEGDTINPPDEGFSKHVSFQLTEIRRDLSSDKKSDEDSKIVEDTTGSHSEMTSLVYKKVPKVKRDLTGRSLLQRACKKGDLEEAKKLIAEGANPNESDFGGFTSLHEAALAGHTEIVKLLLANGADVNKQALEAGDLETPLMDAADNKHIKTVTVLLEHGADPRICNAEGYSTITKLYHLQEEDDEYRDIIELLKKHSADQGDAELVQPVEEREIVDDPFEEYFDNLLKKKTSSMIYRYVALGLKESAAEEFVTHSHSLLKTPDILNLAARNGHVELVDIFLGLNPGDFDINQLNEVGVSALLASVGRDHYDVVKFLLSKGADPRIKRKDGMNALDVAKHSSMYDPREVVLLEEKIASVDEIVPAASVKRQMSEGDSDETLKSHKTVEQPDKRSATPSTEARHATNSAAASTEENDSDQRPTGVADLRKRSGSESMPSSKRAHVDSPETQGIELLPKIKLEDHATPGDEIKEELDEATLKAQEEQRLKAAEEAKIWQEKMQAKKKARREMFLLAEKEKEKRRREEDERRIEAAKKEAEQEEERKREDYKKAEQNAKELELKKQLMERQLLLQKYPIGLQHAKLDGCFSTLNTKYTPLYLVEVADEEYVVDLQLALLLATPTQDLGLAGKPVPGELMDRLWVLFFSMVGVGQDNQIERNGEEKFRNLELNFIPVKQAEELVKSKSDEAYRAIWTEKRLAKVSVDSIDTCEATKALPTAVQTEMSVGFVPWKWRQRADVMRTIQAASTPLW